MHEITPPLPLFRHTQPLFKALLILTLPVGLTACNGVTNFFAKPDDRATEILVEAPPSETASKPESESAATADTKKAEAEEPLPTTKSKLKPNKLFEWKGDGRRVSRIVVDTNEQKARFYDGKEEIGWSTVATGVSKYPTPTGQFSVIEKVENKRSNLYGKVYGKGGKVIKSSVKVGRDPIPAGGRFEGSHMPYFMRLTHDGVGLHAGPIPRPGQPASHGCIRMPSQLAPVLFNHVNSSTQVAIVGKGPSYGNYMEKQRAVAARPAEPRRAAPPKPQPKKAEPAARLQQVATTKPAAPKPAAKPVTPTPTPIPTQIIPGRIIEEQAQAKDDRAIVQPATPPTTGETTLKAEPTAPIMPIPATAPVVKPLPETAVTATPSLPQPSPLPTQPAAPAPTPITPAPALPTTPVPPTQPTPVQATPAVQPTPAPAQPAASAPPPAAKPEPVAAPPQPAAQAPAAPAENKAE